MRPTDVNTGTKFAEPYPRAKAEDSEHQLILFPKDVSYRKSLFPQGVFDHPAKNNIFLLEELWRYLTRPGDTILDPFAGTGTLMLSCLEGRNVVLIELEPKFASLIAEAWGSISQRPDCTGTLALRIGDCRQQLSSLEGQYDACIFSPPYSTSITRGKPLPSEKVRVEGYTASPLNLANLNVFTFEQAMEKVFQRLALRLKPDAPMAIINRDIVRGEGRLHLSEGIIRRASAAGFRLEEWHKWKPPGAAQRAIQESRGARVIKDEDILLFRRA